jgi:hypothetical protein
LAVCLHVTPRTSQPSRPGEPSPNTECTRFGLVGSFSLPSEPACATLRWRPSSRDLEVEGEPYPFGLRSIEVRRKRRFSASEDPPTPLRFLTSSTTSKLRGSDQLWLICSPERGAVVSACSYLSYELA